MLRLSDHVRAIHHAGRTLVLHLQQGRMFSLNPVGSRIVELLRNGFSEREIAEAIAAEFHISPKTAANDIDGFFTVLQGYGFFQK